MRVMVTGADGFVARHLVPFLQAAGHAVVGTALRPDAVTDASVPLRTLDITSAPACLAVVADVRPTHMVHLAAVSSVRWSFDHPNETMRVNRDGTHNILVAALEHGVTRVLVVGSSEEYGLNDGQPLSELPTKELRPLSPYGESKVSAERLIEEDTRFQACTVRTRSFPHLGPGQREGFFTSDIASQLVRMKRGQAQPVLRVGNVDAVRDYTDVRDVVRAYTLLLERGVPGEVYNVCTGRGVSLRELLNQLCALSGVAARIEQDPEKARPSEIPTLVGDPRKLQAATGWAPTVPLEQSLADIFAWWEKRAALA